MRFLLAVALALGSAVASAQTTLQNGVPVNGTTNSQVANGDFRDYTFTIPPGGSNLSVVIDQLSGDVDIYLRFGQTPTLAVWDCRPFLGGTNSETCSVASPTAGAWFVRVYGFAVSPQTFRIRASWEVGAGGNFNGSWVNLGPAPALNGALEGIANNPNSGAINAVAAHPSDANILYVATVNGGIWRTNNATAANPTWTQQGDELPSMSLRTIRFDRSDPNFQTLLAGAGTNSSFGGTGGGLTGLVRTTNGGAAWSPILSGAGSLVGRQIVGAEARGDSIMVATDAGFFRSANGGATFTLVSEAGGLPAGRNTDLVADPSDIGTFYVSVLGPTLGIYQTSNLGISWFKISNAAVDATLRVDGHVRMSAGPAGQLWVAVVGSNGQLAAVFRLLGTWTNLGVPNTAELNGTVFGAHPGGQGKLHLSIAADPTNSNIAYVGGDRQPCFNEGAGNTSVCFPNSLGSTTFSGRLFRATAGGSPVWQSLTHSGAGNNSAPHADSRGMGFDAAGNLIEVDDGGIYKRISPRTTTGSWVSLNGNLSVTEYIGIAFDSVSNRVFGGSQDNGSTRQQQTGSSIFATVQVADGGDPAVNDVSSLSTSARYTSFQNLAGFTRQVFNAADALQGTTFPALAPIAPSPAIAAQFYTPIAINRVNGLRLVVLANNGVYESLNEGATVTRLSTIRGNAFVGDPLIYGVPGNAEFLYLASGTGLYLRTTAGGALALRSNLGTTTIVDVAADSTMPTRLFAMSSNSVSLSTNSASTFSNITGNLTQFGTGQYRSMVFVPRAAGNVLAVGTDRGVFYSLAPNFNQWAPLGLGLPKTLVFELEYSARQDALIAGLLGRGAWRLGGINPVLTDDVFRNGFEQ